MSTPRPAYIPTPAAIAEAAAAEAASRDAAADLCAYYRTLSEESYQRVVAARIKAAEDEAALDAFMRGMESYESNAQTPTVNFANETPQKGIIMIRNEGGGGSASWRRKEWAMLQPQPLKRDTQILFRSQYNFLSCIWCLYSTSFSIASIIKVT